MPRSPTRPPRADGPAPRPPGSATMRDLFAHQRAVVPAPADRVVGLRRRPALHLRRRGAGGDRLRPLRVHASSTTGPQILPLLRQALRLNPDLKVMGTPWSPPAWMKANDSLIGGRMKDDPRVYQAYADYLVKFVQAYEARGRARLRPDHPERAAEPEPQRLPRHRPAGRGRRPRSSPALGPALRARRPRHQDLRLRPQLVAAPGRLASRPRPARTRRPTTRPTCSSRGRRAGSPARRTTATPATRSG